MNTLLIISLASVFVAGKTMRSAIVCGQTILDRYLQREIYKFVAQRAHLSLSSKQQLNLFFEAVT